MKLLSAKEIFNRLNEDDECSLIEAKTASQIGKSIFETISAFSNEPDAGGGYLILGVGRDSSGLFPGYEIKGITNPDKMQSDLATQCKEVFSTPIAPRMVSETIDGRSVVVAFIPEADPHNKPVYIKSKGPINGSFRRVGPTDQRCTDEDLALFFQARGSTTFDESAIDGTSMSDIDPMALAIYRESRRSSDNASDLVALPDLELLYALNAITEHTKSAKLTMAGLVLFGRASSLRRNLPMSRVDYIVVEGNEWVSDTEARYQTVEKFGPLLSTIPQLITLVLENIPKAFHLPELSDVRRDKPLIPRKVIREAIVNALMHRSYRLNQPVQIIRFGNRIEIINPGYSLISDERLGLAGSRARNPKIAATLHDAGFAETKGTGIKVMRESMERANLTHPLIVSDRLRDEFRLSLLVHHFLGESDIQWLSKFSDCGLSEDEARAMILLRDMKSIDNTTYRQLNHMDSLSASGHLRRLRDLNLLEKKGRGAKTRYTPGDRFFSTKKTRRKASPVEPLTDAQRQELHSLRQHLSKDLVEKIDNLPKRTAVAQLNAIISEICNCRPFNAIEIGFILGKNPEHLRRRNIKSLLKKGDLEYQYPEEPNHPNQRYVATVPKG